MSYASKFIKSKGMDCVIDRSVPIQTKVSIKRSTKASRDLGIREGYWEGLIPIEVNLKSGETITIRDVNYLVQSTNYDHSSSETAFFSAKCNAVIKHKRYFDDVDDNYNPIQEWRDVDLNKISIPVYGEVVTSRLRQEEPGLLEGTIYIFQVPKKLGVVEMDRIVHNGKPYQVASVDDIGLDGVSRIQLAKDLRP